MYDLDEFDQATAYNTSTIAPRDFGLTAIYLVDSYPKGRIVKVETDGHTLLTGSNGDGKTAFLRLLPVFYGETPGTMVRGSASVGNKSFAKFYFPRPCSYVVYEYLSHGSPKMAIFFDANGTETVDRIFADSAFRDDLFLNNEKDNFAPSNTLYQRLRSANIGYHRCGSVDEFRSTLLKGRAQKSAQFGLCERIQDLYHITPLFKSMFSRSASFDDLAIVIQDYATDKLSPEGRDNLRSFPVKPSDYEVILEEYDVLQALEFNLRHLSDLKSSREAYLATLKSIAALKEAATIKLDELQKTQHELNERREEIVTQKLDRLEELQTEHEAIRERQEAAERRLQDPKAELQEITSRLGRYQRHNMDAKKELVETLPDLQKKRDQLQSELRALQNQIQDVSARIQSQVQDLQNLKAENSNYAQKREIELGEQRGQLKDQHHQHVERIRERARATEERLKTEFEKQASELRQKIHDLDKQIERKRGEMASPSAPQELLKQNKALNTNRLTAEQERDTAERELNAAETRLSEARENYDHAERDYRRQDQVESDIGEQIGRLKTLINGPEGSLIQFLNRNKPGWEDTLGRLLSDDVLLHNQNLKPRIIPGSHDSTICGIEIDFSGLPNADLNPERLQLTLSELERKYETALKETKLAAAKLSNCSKAHERAHKEKAEALSNRDAAKRKVEEARKLYEENNREIDKAKREARESIEASITELQENVATLRQELDSHKIKHDTQLNEANNTEQREINEAQTETNQQVAKIDEAIRNLQRDCRAEEQRLNGLISKIKQGQPDNEKEVEQLNERLSTIETEIAKAKESESEVQVYLAFLNEEVPKIEGLRESVEAIQRDIKATKDELVTHRKEKDAEEKNFDRSIRETEQKIAGVQDNQTQLENRVITHDPLVGVATVADPDTVELYSQQSPEAIANKYQQTAGPGIREKHNALKEKTERFLRVFHNSRRDNSPNSALNAIIESLEKDDALGDDRTLIHGTAIVRYFEGDGKSDHDTIKGALAQSFMGLDAIVKYESALKRVESNIKRFGKELSDHINQARDFPSIQNIQVNIDFDLTKLNYWSYIRSLARQVEEWKRNNGGLSRELPHPGLIHELKNYLRTQNSSMPNDTGLDLLYKQINFSFQVVENGQLRNANNPRELESISSNGLSYIVLIVVFQAFLQSLRGDSDIHFNWAIDELRALDHKNRSVLLEMLEENNIHLITACPDYDNRDTRIFDAAYRINRPDKQSDERDFMRIIHDRNEGNETEGLDNPFAHALEGDLANE
ncbi:MAG: hypothetical protein AWU57_201 [Marinobacter sp. T13-3]|nr:MAG: hypothetical protein AWU57_201 [Marinobacter sp. T13-3]